MMFKKITRLLLIMLFLQSGNLCAARIAVVTMAIGTEYEKAVATGSKNKFEYCQRHGYDFFYCNHSLDPSRPIPWSKIKLVKSLLQTGNYDWVFWTDADSLIMNPHTTLESLINDHYSLIISIDPISPLNTGQFLIKNCQWSLDLLDNIYAQTAYINDSTWEQSALASLLQKDQSLYENINHLPQRVMNSFLETYEPGDFIIHFVAMRDLGALKYNLDYFYSWAYSR